MEDAARKEVSGKYDWEAVVDKVEELLNRVTSGESLELADTAARQTALVTS